MIARAFRSLLMIALLPGFHAVAGSAMAQEAAESAAAPETEVRTLPPAYDEQMVNLAEALGSLHYLRALCGTGEGQLWRDQMQSMLNAEEPSDERRAQLVAAFNRGFRGYREIHRECTPSAAEAANQHLRQGIRLAAEIPNRYGR